MGRGLRLASASRVEAQSVKLLEAAFQIFAGSTPSPPPAMPAASPLASSGSTIAGSGERRHSPDPAIQPGVFDLQLTSGNVAHVTVRRTGGRLEVSLRYKSQERTDENPEPGPISPVDRIEASALLEEALRSLGWSRK